MHPQAHTRPERPQRWFGLLFGGLIVAAGMSIFSPGGIAAKDDPTPTDADAAVCKGDAEVNRLSRHLRARHDGLQADFLALEREQEELQFQREELDARLEELRELRRDVTSRIARWEARDARERSTRLRQLISIVGDMKPAGAASILAKSEPTLAADVLLQLEQKQAARILESMPPDAAADLARRLAAFRARKDAPADAPADAPPTAQPPKEAP
jgi:flagellar motility protein MotE (MotC chaperone)